MKKIILLPIILSVTAFCANDIQDNIINTSGDGKSNVNIIDGQFHSMKKEEKDYTKEVLLNYILQRESLAFKTVDSSQAGFVVIKDTKPKEVTKEDETTKLVSVVGYCLIDATVDIGKQPMSSSFDCNTNIGAVKLFGNFVPYHELESLFVTALHIEKNAKKYKVENAKILNEDRTSYNIATYVNNRKIEKIALESTSQAASHVQQGANDYMDQLEASRVNQAVYMGDGSSYSNGQYNPPQYGGNGNMIMNSGGGLQATNVDEPVASDYIIKGAVDIVTGTIKTIADIYKADLPYLYQVVGKSKIYIDLYVNPKEMSLDSTIDNNVNNTNYTTLQGRATTLNTNINNVGTNIDNNANNANNINNRNPNNRNNTIQQGRNR